MCECKHAATSSSLKPRLSIPDLSCSFGENLQAVRDKIGDGKLGFEATPTAEDKLSKSVIT